MPFLEKKTFFHLVELLAVRSINIRKGSMRATRQYEGNNTPLDYYTDRSPMGHGQYNGKGVYCGLSTVSEVFLIFTTQLYQY